MVELHLSEVGGWGGGGPDQERVQEICASIDGYSHRSR